jgi:hypothetical protein
MNRKLSVRKAILYAFNSLVDHPLYFIKIFLLWIGVCGGLMLLTVLLGLPVALALSQPHFSLFSLFFFPTMLLAFFLFYCIATMLWIIPAKLTLRFYDKGDESITVSSVFSLFHLGLLLRLFAAMTLYALLVMGGMVLLIVPGIYCAVKFQFVLYNLIDKNCGVITAFKNSYVQTTGNFWPALAIFFIAGTCAKLIIPLPLSYLMLTYTYRHLEGNND